MKVFRQDWESLRVSEIISLSKNLEALNQTKGEMVTEEDPPTPTGEPEEITIPDDSVFADLVKLRGTVFLCDDELDIVFDAPEYQ